jgi:cell division septum initiation protein DivIVA
MTPLTTASPGAGGALEPVRAWLLAAARAQAEHLVAEAAADAERLLTGARAEADAILAEAREQGIAEGSALAVAERAHTRRLARRLVLDAERQTYEELRARSRAAVRALRQDPGYPALRERLTRLSLAAAGPDARVSEHPDGGVVAEAPGIRVDCTLDSLAERAVMALGGEVAELWAP